MLLCFLLSYLALWVYVWQSAYAIWLEFPIKGMLRIGNEGLGAILMKILCIYAHFNGFESIEVLYIILTSTSAPYLHST